MLSSSSVPSSSPSDSADAPSPIGEAPAPTTVPSNINRVIGLDLARFVALVGMMATHTWMYADLETGEEVWGTALFEGRAAALFAVLAGVGIVLSTRSWLSAGNSGAARWALIGRGVALLAVGLTLAIAPTNIMIILAYYGLMFMVLSALVTLRSWLLIVIASLLAVIGPFATFAHRSTFGEAPAAFGNLTWVSLGDPVGVLNSLAVTGAYPVVALSVYGIVGILVGRAVLHARTAGAVRAAALRLAVVGIAVWGAGLALAGIARYALGGIHSFAISVGASDAAVEQYISRMRSGGSPSYIVELLSTAAHTGTTFDLMLTAGCALTVIGILLYLGTKLGPRVLRILSPATGAGSAPLTVYVTHVLIVSLVVFLGLGKPLSEIESREEVFAFGTPWFISSALFFAINVAMALAIGALLVRLKRRGPMETFVTWAGRRFAQLGGGKGREVARVAPVSPPTVVSERSGSDGE